MTVSENDKVTMWVVVTEETLSGRLQLVRAYRDEQEARQAIGQMVNEYETRFSLRTVEMK